MNTIIGLTLRLVTVGILIFSLPEISFTQSGKLDNELFQLKITLPGWLPMAKSSLLERSDYASENSGRTITYIDGLSNTLDVVPHIIFQQIDADMGTTNIEAYLRDMSNSVSRPSRLHEDASPMPMPKTHTEMHFNLYEEYALMTSELVYENEPCVNFSYFIPHGKGLMYMHSYCHVMDTERFYPEFEQIRKDLKFIFPTSSSPKPTASNSNSEAGQDSTTSSSSNLPKYLFMVLALVLLLFILGKASKPKDS